MGWLSETEDIYTSFEELIPTLLREFVEKIVIHESEALDGKRRGKLRRQDFFYFFISHEQRDKARNAYYTTKRKTR